MAHRSASHPLPSAPRSATHPPRAILGVIGGRPLLVGFLAVVAVGSALPSCTGGDALDGRVEGSGGMDGGAAGKDAAPNESGGGGSGQGGSGGGNAGQSGSGGVVVEQGGSGGESPECTVASQCPMPASKCVESTCDDHRCGIHPLEAGTTVPQEAGGDCAVLACDGIGNAVCVEPAVGPRPTVAAGQEHTCAITPAGGVMCWGANSYGQLGDNTAADKLNPTQAVGLTSNVVAVTAGSYHSCALTSSGTVLCWGYNYAGQLGDGSQYGKRVPTVVSGLPSNIAAVAAGGNHTCALDSTGAVRCWGLGFHGQLGNGNTQNNLVPELVLGLSTGVIAVSAGGHHSCAVTSVGSVLCWGHNAFGAIGDNSTTGRLTPTPVFGLSLGATAITAGGLHTCAITSMAGVGCWGANAEGQLGNNTTTGSQVPAPVIGLSSGVAVLATQSDHTCAITSAGGLLCWGANDMGQIGDGTNARKLVPTPIPGLSDGISAVAAAGKHTCAMRPTGGLLCWGANTRGQLGDGTNSHRWLPTPVVGFP